MKRARAIQKTFCIFLISGLTGSFISSCSKKSASSSDAATESDTKSSFEVGKLIPTALNIAVFPQDLPSASLRLLEGGTSALEEAVPSSEALKNVKEEASKILSGDVDSCLPDSFLQVQNNASNESCYEFDQEMMYGSRGQQTHGTVTGKNSKDEACLVAFARTQVDQVNVIIKHGMTMMQTMLCQAKKDSVAIELTKKDDFLDLKTQLANALGTKLKSKDISVAKISLLNPGSETESPIYRTDLTMTLTVNDNSPAETIEMHLVHSPKSTTDESTYKGVLWMKRSSSAVAKLHLDDMPNPQGAPNQDSEKSDYLSVEYNLSLDAAKNEKLNARLYHAKIKDSLVETLGTAAVFPHGVLNLNLGTNESGVYQEGGKSVSDANSIISGIMTVQFSLNVADNTGIVSYWQNPGGNYDENARGMVFELTQEETDGASFLKGCGYSGSAGNGPAVDGKMIDRVSIRKIMKEGTGSLVPRGFYHPFMNAEEFSTVDKSKETITFKSVQSDCKTIPQGFSSGTVTIDSVDYKDLTYLEKSCQEDTTWYEPRLKTEDGFIAKSWIVKQTGPYVTKQCVVQNTHGVYEIDATKTTEDAGFSIIDTEMAPIAEMPELDLSDLTALAIE